MFRPLYRASLTTIWCLVIVASCNAYSDDSSISFSDSGSFETDYSKSSHSNEGVYSYRSGSSHYSSDPGYSYNYVTSHSSSPLTSGLYGIEYASDFDSYLPLEIELELDSDLDYDTDLDYDSYFDYDLDYNPHLDPDFIKYKYHLYGLNHFGLSGPYYNDLKFGRRFKKWSRRPYFHKLGYNRINKLSPFWKYDLDLDLDLDDWGLGLGVYGLKYGYDKYSIGYGDLSSPLSYVKFHRYS